MCETEVDEVLYAQVVPDALLDMYAARDVKFVPVGTVPTNHLLRFVVLATVQPLLVKSVPVSKPPSPVGEIKIVWALAARYVNRKSKSVESFLIKQLVLLQ
jgi:hypothetical protein